MKTSAQDSRFAWQALCVFFALGGWVFLLKLAEEAGLVSALTEGLMRLIPGALSFIAIGWLSRGSDVSPAIRVTFVVFALTLCIEMGLNTTEDVQMLDDVALIGNNSPSRRVFERLLGGIWFGAGFFLIFLTVKSLRQTKQQLEAALAELNEIQEQTIRRERINGLGEMASGIAHDLNNTLAPMVAYTEATLTDPRLAPELHHRCECALQAATDAAAIVRRLGHFYRNRENSAEFEAVSLDEILSQVQLLTRPKWRDEAQLEGRTYSVKLDLADIPPIHGNAAELRTVFTNLVFNSVDAMPDGGTITLRLSRSDDFAVVEVIDTGIGMTEEQAVRCFEPFFSTKTEKSGLGLSVCHGIVRQHGGTIEVESGSSHGVIVRVLLPFSVKQIAATADISSQPDRNGRLRCLYIEDDDVVRDAFATMLDTMGADVDLAADAGAGLAMVQASEYDIVFTDLGMNDTDGAEVLQHIKRARPDLPVAVISGWPHEEVLARFEGKPQPDHIIEKPATLRVIQNAVSTLVPKMAPARSDQL